LEDFNYSYQPSLDRVLITHLATCAFITDASNIVFLGPPGTGETHLAISLGIKACEQGYNVMFKNALDWIRDLEDAQSHGLLNHRLKQLSSIKLLIIDELGYIPLDASAANLLFQLISNRYEHGSVIITSNLEFARWGQTLADPTVAAALIDRLVHHCDIIALKGDSYRTKTRLTTNNKINTQN
jgi:DNA replication protein DnaC